MSARDKKLPYGRQSISQEDIEAVVECLRGDFLTQGPRVVQFEDALRRLTGSSGAAAVSNGTAALHLACAALDMGPGSFGLTSAITFVASANAVRYTGAQVGLIDVDPRSGLITPETTEQAFHQSRADGAPRPQVLIPVDLAGQPVQLAELFTLAHSRQTYLLHDAAHSLGASYLEGDVSHQVGDGSHADATIFSFHPVKHITTGEGGAVLSPHDWVMERVNRLRSHGITKDSTSWCRSPDDPFVGSWFYEQQELGFNYRLPDLNCALGISQLKQLSAFVDRRRSLAKRYDALFQDEELREYVVPLTQHQNAQSSYHLYVIRLLPQEKENAGDVAARRKSLYNALQKSNIYTQVHYIPVSWHSDFQSSWRPAQGLPGAETYYSGCLSLPLFPSMHDDDTERVVNAIKNHLLHT